MPPQTRTPVTFNQQINVQHIPQRAWEKLSPDQIFELSKQVIEQVDRIDTRHFEWAKQASQQQEERHKRSTLVGGLVGTAGLLIVTYLTMNGHEVIAAIIATFLVTLVAVIVGRQLRD
ncbi:MAG: hypothetical protein K2X35_12845 [Bryobacteraceae bacterium]|nr:hypothetical protein [Bryobacteraceae bacterium]